MGGTWDGRRVLVTGAGGFIGSHVAEALARAGADVRAFVRYTSRNEHGWLDALPPDVRGGIEVFRGDLVDADAVDGAVSGCEAVLHLGALIPIPYSYQHPREYVDVNVTGTLNVLQAVRRHGVARLVHTSTSEVYGTPASVPIAETHPLNAQSPYAATKVGADQLALSFHAAFGLPVVIVRPFNTYGPRQSARAVIPTIVTQALALEEVTLGTTGTTRDFLYVADTAAGMLRCAEAEGVEGGVVNLGTGVETSIAELVRLVGEVVGREIAVAFDEQRARPSASEVERLCADASRAAELLGWRPEVDLRTGLERTVAWFTGSLAAYEPRAYNI